MQGLTTGLALPSAPRALFLFEQKICFVPGRPPPPSVPFPLLNNSHWDPRVVTVFRAPGESLP